MKLLGRVGGRQGAGKAQLGGRGRGLAVPGGARRGMSLSWGHLGISSRQGAPRALPLIKGWLPQVEALWGEDLVNLCRGPGASRVLLRVSPRRTCPGAPSDGVWHSPLLLSQGSFCSQGLGLSVLVQAELGSRSRL